MAYRVLITGGTGFIGSRLALRCRELGHDVRVFGQANTPAEEENRRLIEAAGVEIRMGSVTDRDGLDAAVDSMDLVFHLAAAQHEANVPDQRFWDVNVTGAKTLLDACVKAKVRRVVHGSTIGVYGALDGEIDERSPVQPDNIYGTTKLEAERALLARRDELPLVIIRIPETYGPGDRRLLKLFKAIKSGVFFMIGSGRNRHHLIYIDDLLDGLLLAAERDEAAGDIFLLAGKDRPTTDEMVATIARQLGSSGPRFRAPLWLFMAAATVIEGVFRPLGIRPPLHRRRMDFFRKSYVFSGDKAASILNFHAKTGFADGAAATAKWYEDNGLL